jgi:hypothetical protein
MLTLGYANAQVTTTGAQDNFATTTEPTGITWDAGLFTMTRPGDFTLNFAGTGLGGYADGNPDPVIRVDFASPLDLSDMADIQVDITNVSSNKLIMKMTLVDGNDVIASIEPNVSDVTSNLGWGDAVNGKYPRKADNGFVLNANTRATYRIDLSSNPNAMGGLTRIGWVGDNGCNNDGPYCGPVTDYLIDTSDIVAVIFTANYHDGRYIMTMGQGDGDYTDDYIIADANREAEVQPFTGTIKFHDFKVGSALTSVKDAAVIEKSLSVYPNPAKEALNISFESIAGAQITLSNVVGSEVYSASANVGENQFTVNTSDLPQGLYIVNVATENGRVARKVMIK